MGEFMMKLGQKTPLLITFFLFLVNYYMLLFFIGASYDSIYKLNGGPATMYAALNIGPWLSILLSLITVVLLYIFKKKKAVGGIIIFTHLVIILLIIVAMGYAFISLYFEGKIRSR
ncbi:hypothetical protein OB236_09615 [Paenibacillus sp. WQ 127069]|uniref:Uncharacterized protein n=1 Tax=Paenibacillus baimaensis TaxID=2982185 RepID=A0ABT2UCR5_9BACL|nr:hypothetical protein [Paenibacillus sp. WQ 127069]MCU6792385.1 hypothetical protein [Paenibacillus sp. WQ 127069]